MASLDEYIQSAHTRVVRINSSKEIPGEEILEFWKNQGMDLVILGIERIPHLHYHLVISTKKSPDFGAQNNKLKRKIREQFSVEKSEFSTSSVRTTVRKTILYTIKDCELYYYGIPDEIINVYKTQSTRKFKKKEFKERMDQIENDWYDSKINLDGFIDRYIDLKIEYGQNPNPNGEQRYLVKHIIKKDPEERKNYKDNIYFGINQTLGKMNERY